MMSLTCFLLLDLLYETNLSNLIMHIHTSLQPSHEKSAYANQKLHAVVVSCTIVLAGLTPAGVPSEPAMKVLPRPCTAPQCVLSTSCTNVRLLLLAGAADRHTKLNFLGVNHNYSHSAGLYFDSVLSTAHIPRCYRELLQSLLYKMLLESPVLDACWN
jgi:hypothetical protein